MVGEWRRKGAPEPQNCNAVLPGDLGRTQVARDLNPTLVSQPITVRLAQTLEVERHLGLGLDSGFLLVNRNPRKVFPPQ